MSTSWAVDERALLAEDAVVAMPPMATWFRGRDGVEMFLRITGFVAPALFASFGLPDALAA